MFRLLWWCCIYFIYNISAASLFVSPPLRHPPFFFSFCLVYPVPLGIKSGLPPPCLSSIKERIITQICGVCYRKKKVIRNLRYMKEHISYLGTHLSQENMRSEGTFDVEVSACDWMQGLLEIIFKGFQWRKVQDEWVEVTGNCSFGPPNLLQGKFADK